MNQIYLSGKALAAGYYTLFTVDVAHISLPAASALPLSFNTHFKLTTRKSRMLSTLTFRKSFIGFLACSLCLALTLSLLNAKEPPVPVATPANAPFAINTQDKKDIAPTSEAALAKMTIGKDFKISIFAGSPDVYQPLAMCFDDRGRLWVVENYSYPEWKEGVYDRILIFEDTDNDGKFDKRKIFYDKGVHLTGIQFGFGGVWCTAAPNLIFIPDKNGDDIPDGEPQVVLDGFNIKEVGHNVVSGIIWGPDGWLYGRHGIKASSKVGIPGTPDKERTLLNCSIWRFHPTRKTFEVVVEGTTNPWGFDYDDYGQMFLTNNVNGYLWHAVPGSYYERMYGTHFNSYLYELMQKCNDHQHWQGKTWVDSRKKIGKENPNDAMGGGHSHCGGMIYLGGKWGAKYRGNIFTCNTHGKRVNQTRLERLGSGYVGKRAPDFLKTNSDWFRGVELKYGPDGDVYVTDWVDLGECHDHDGIHRTSGRIYKVIHKEASKPNKQNLQSMSDSELVQLQLHTNDWYVRHARRILQERATNGQKMLAVHESLRNIFNTNADVTRKLRALWALSVTGGMESDRLARQLNHSNEHIRLWAIRLLTDEETVSDDVIQKFAVMAKEDKSALVRLYLASALRKLPVEKRWGIAQGLATHAEDAVDKDLPLLLWYGIEPSIPHHTNAAIQLLQNSKIPKLQQFIAQRITADIDQNKKGMNLLLTRLQHSKTKSEQQQILTGIQNALQGRLKVKEPTSWNAVRERFATEKDADIKKMVNSIAVTFGDGIALAELRKIMLNKKVKGEIRQQAIRTLVTIRADQLELDLQRLITDHAVNNAAIRGLSAFDHPKTSTVLLGRYRWFDKPEKTAAIDTLVSRVSFAKELLTAIEKKRLPVADLTSYQAQQIFNLNDSKLNTRLENVWGTLKETPAEKQKIMTRLKKRMTKKYLAKADLPNGRLLFRTRCAVCHTLFDDGNKVSPNLTGSGRANIDYVLQNVVTPSAIVAADYRVWIFELKSGRVLSGFIKQKDEKRITIQSVTETIIIDRNDIEESKATGISLMPENLLKGLSDEQIRDLIAYLASPTQVNFPKGASVPPLTLESK